MRWPESVASAALLAALYACGDMATQVREPAVSRSREAFAAPRGSRLRDPALPYACFGSAMAENGPAKYRYATQRLHFSSADHASDRSLALYRVRYQTADGEVVEAFTCRIPNTPEAIVG